jgi:hypothetical protein
VRCLLSAVAFFAVTSSCFAASARQGQVYVSRTTGIVNNQCAGATPITQFTTDDTRIYLYAVIDNVQAGESLTVIWENPTGTGSVDPFDPMDTAYSAVCFSDSLSFPSGFAPGTWKVHLMWDSASSNTELATVTFTVTSSAGGVSINLQTVLQKLNLSPGAYSNTGVLSSQGLTIIPNPRGHPEQLEPASFGCSRFLPMKFIRQVPPQPLSWQVPGSPITCSTARPSSGPALAQ